MAGQASVEIWAAVVFDFTGAADGEFGVHSLLALELTRLLVIICVLSDAAGASVVRDVALSIDTKAYRRPRLRAAEGELMRVDGVFINGASVDAEREGTAAGWTLAITQKDTNDPS